MTNLVWFNLQKQSKVQKLETIWRLLESYINLLESGIAYPGSWHPSITKQETTVNGSLSLSKGVLYQRYQPSRLEEDLQNKKNLILWKIKWVSCIVLQS